MDSYLYQYLDSVMIFSRISFAAIAEGSRTSLYKHQVIVSRRKREVKQILSE